MSSFLQIETLWRFNAKFGPDWLPRYVVYDAAEHMVPAILAILRAESLAEVPVIGRVLVRSQRRATRSGRHGGGGAPDLGPSGNGAAERNALSSTDRS
jgi:lysyl-tRNA synthetase class 2